MWSSAVLSLRPRAVAAGRALSGDTLIISAYALFLVTAIGGRLFCGYVCPQTVTQKSCSG